VDPNERFPRYTVNPELWIRPLPGTGIVAGRVWDAQGRPAQQARVYGLIKAEPQETPYSYAETYGEHNHPDPDYGEHFAVTDVEPGDYTLAVVVDGRKMTRRVRVDAARVTGGDVGSRAHCPDGDAALPGAPRRGVPRDVHGRNARPHGAVRGARLSGVRAGIRDHQGSCAILGEQGAGSRSWHCSGGPRSPLPVPWSRDSPGPPRS